MGANPKGYANSELVIAPSELTELLDSVAEGPAPAIIDVRPAEDFAAGHLPGACHFDLYGLTLIDTDPAPLEAFMYMIKTLLASRGVSADAPAIVYDDKTGMRAARAFWFLDYFGHRQVRVLDGGFDAWRRAGHCVTTETTPPAARGWEAARGRSERLATWRDLADRLGRPGAVILDTRSDGEYAGTTKRARRGGAVPGAVHVEWTRNLDADGEFQPAEALQAMYAAAGVTADQEIIAYCHGGYRSAHSYLALRLLGYPRVRNYVGSWKE